MRQPQRRESTDPLIHGACLACVWQPARRASKARVRWAHRQRHTEALRGNGWEPTQPTGGPPGGGLRLWPESRRASKPPGGGIIIDAVSVPERRRDAGKQKPPGCRELWHHLQHARERERGQERPGEVHFALDVLRCTWLRSRTHEGVARGGSARAALLRAVRGCWRRGMRAAAGQRQRAGLAARQ
jgi:hypothetical protein